MSRRRRAVLAAAGALTTLVVAGCGGVGGQAQQPQDFVPSFPSDEPTTGGAAAPVIDGVPPCPPSIADAPQRPGTPALPALTLRCLTRGPDVTLSGLRGRPTVITVWASWCVPCRDELPLFSALPERYGDRLRVLGIDIRDRPAPARALVEDLGLTFPSVEDPRAQTRAALGFIGPPVTVLVDADGAVVHRENGQITSAEQLDRLIDRYLGVRPT